MRPATILLAALALLAAAAPADAGQYRVLGCHVPSTGASTGTPGWSSSVQAANGKTLAADACRAPGGGLGVEMVAGAVAGSYGVWTFRAPARTTIDRARLWVYGDLGVATAGGGLAAFEPGVTGDPRRLVTSIDGAGHTIFGRDDLTTGYVLDGDLPLGGEAPALSVSLRCVASSVCGADAVTKLLASDIVLGDTSAPAPGKPFGSVDLASGGTSVTGAASFGMTATDAGGGLARAWLEVDGVPGPQVPFADVTPTCTPQPGGDGLPVYTEVVPCPRSSSVLIGWDSRSVADGPHGLALWAEDAVGNRAILSQGQVTVANAPGAAAPPGGQVPQNAGGASPGDLRGPVNGSVATDRASLGIWWQRGAKGVPAVRAGWSATGTSALGGRLTDPAGRPIAGAKVEVLTTPIVALRSETRVLGTAWTGPGGAFTFPVPVRLGSSAVVVQWRGRMLDRLPAATSKPITRQVASGLTLAATPRTVRRGGSVRFRGALLGDSGVPDGVPVTVQVWGAGRWNPVPSVSAAERGTWSKRITFKNSRGRIRVRAVSGRAALYPYGPGVSPVVTVRVR